MKVREGEINHYTIKKMARKALFRSPWLEVTVMCAVAIMIQVTLSMLGIYHPCD